jgi:hypothetical protein
MRGSRLKVDLRHRERKSAARSPHAANSKDPALQQAHRAPRHLGRDRRCLDACPQNFIPDHFTLIVVRKKTIYSCAVIWREGTRVGVSFCRTMSMIEERRMSQRTDVDETAYISASGSVPKCKSGPSGLAATRYGIGVAQPERTKATPWRETATTNGRRRRISGSSSCARMESRTYSSPRRSAEL